MRARRIALVLTALIAAAMPAACAPDPTRSVTVELFDLRGNPIPGSYLVSNLGETIVDLSMTDAQGRSPLRVADAGQVTAFRIGTNGNGSLTVDVPDGPIVRMRSLFIFGSPLVTVHVTGPPHEYAHVHTPESAAYGGYLPENGPLVIPNIQTSGWSFHNDGSYAAGAYVRTPGGEGLTHWGYAVDVPIGQIATVALRSTNDSPIIQIHQLNQTGCNSASVYAVHERGDATLWPGAFANSLTSAMITLQPWGADLADTVATRGHCTRSNTAGRSTFRFRPYPDLTPAIDHAPRVPDVSEVEISQTGGRPSIRWTAGDPLSTDLITGYGLWKTADGGSHHWEFRIHPRAAGSHALVHPPLPEGLPGVRLVTDTSLGIVQYTEADFADGYDDGWKLYGRPRPGSCDIQTSYEKSGYAYRLPF